jgi:hypothetical protein
MSVPTIEEYLSSKGYAKPEHILLRGENVVNLIREYSGMQVEEAKKAIWEEFKNGVDEDMEEVLMNCYPLENIK